MALPGILDVLTPLDLVAVAVLLVSWQLLSWLVERPNPRRPSTYVLMLEHRREWMRQMVDRDPRIYDSQILGALQRTATFFASATMIGLGGGIALLGQAERGAAVVGDLAGREASVLVWEIKLALTLSILILALLKFIWSVRIYGYQAVVMSAVPGPDVPGVHEKADRAATLNIYAARSFNRGLRATYVSLASLSWLIGPEALIAATLFTTGVVIRREYYSRSREALL